MVTPLDLRVKNYKITEKNEITSEQLKNDVDAWLKKGNKIEEGEPSQCLGFQGYPGGAHDYSHNVQ